jgi:hypothetical protein
MTQFSKNTFEVQFGLSNLLSSEDECLLLNKLRIGKRPSMLASKQLQSHIKQGSIQDPVSLLSKVVDHLTEINQRRENESLTEFLILTQLLLPHLYRTPKASCSARDGETHNNDAKTNPFDLLFRILYLILEILRWSFHALQDRQLSIIDLKTTRTNFSLCIENFELVVSKSRLLALVLMEKEQNPQRFEHFRLQLKMLYKDVRQSPHLAIKVIFKPLWDAALCLDAPHSLLFRIEKPLNHNLFGIHLMKQCALNNEHFPSLTLALIVHDELSGVRFQTLENSAAKLEYFRRICNMPRHLFYAELWSAVFRYDAQCLDNTNRQLKCRTFLFVKIPLLMALWNTKKLESFYEYSFSSSSSAFLTALNDCNDVELSLVHLSRLTSTLSQTTLPPHSATSSFGLTTTSSSTKPLLTEVLNVCAVHNLISPQRLQNLVTLMISQEKNTSTKRSEEMSVDERITLRPVSDLSILMDALAVVNLQFPNSFLVEDSPNNNNSSQSVNIEQVLQRHILQTQQEVRSLLEYFRRASVAKNTEVMSVAVSCVANSLCTQWKLQEDIVTLILEVLNPNNKVVMPVVSLFCNALCNESVLSVLHYHPVLPQLLKYMIHYCDTYGYISSPEAHEYFTSTFLLLLVLLEFYQVKIYSQNQKIVLDVLKEIQHELQPQSQHNRYTFTDWYREYLNNIVDGSVDCSGCGSVLILLFLHPENPPPYITKYGAWSVLESLNYVLKQVWQVKIYVSQSMSEDTSQNSLISNDALMQGLITLFRTSPYVIPMTLLWITNNIYFSADFTTQFAAGVLVALVESFFPNQMGIAECPLSNNVKTALRLIMKRPFLGLFAHILTELKPEREKLLSLICSEEDRDDVERSFVTVSSLKEILQVTFHNVIKSPSLSPQRFTVTQMAVIASHMGFANYCNSILQELLISVGEQWCTYPQALRSAELAAYLLGSSPLDVLIHLLSVAIIENCLPRIHTVLEGQILAYCVFLAILHSDLLKTLETTQRLTLTEKRVTVALHHFLFGLTELLERIEKQRSVAITHESECADKAAAASKSKTSTSNNNFKILDGSGSAQIQPVLVFVLTFLELASMLENFLPRYVPSQRLGKILLKLKAKHLVTSLFSLKTEKGRQELFEFYRKRSAATHTTSTPTITKAASSTLSPVVE